MSGKATRLFPVECARKARRGLSSKASPPRVTITLAHMLIYSLVTLVGISGECAAQPAFSGRPGAGFQNRPSAGANPPISGPAAGLLEPFWQFTLFCPGGADLPDSIANRITTDENGCLVSEDPPLVILQQRQEKGWTGSNPFPSPTPDPGPPVSDYDRDLLWKSGKVFLGSRRGSTLALNTCAGHHQGPPLKAVGEGFHLYFSRESMGWLTSQEWADEFKSGVPSLYGVAAPIFVDVGIHRDLPLTMSNRTPIFWNAFPDVTPQGSGLHLFGLPGRPTPGMVFGPVGRRFFRSFGLLFHKLNRVLPLPAFTEWQWNAELRQYIQGFLGNRGGGSLKPSDFVQTFAERVPWKTYSQGDPRKGLCPLMPGMVENPVNSAIPTVLRGCQNTESWKKLAPTLGFPEKAAGSGFLGIETLLPRGLPTPPPWPEMLATPTVISETGSSIFRFNHPVSQPGFLLEPSSEGGMRLSLGGTAFFRQDIVIESPLEIGSGGVIICEKTITVWAPIINPNLHAGGEKSAGSMLTLVAPQIRIGLPPSRAGIGTVHAFMVAMDRNGRGEVVAERPFHLIGGIAADDISSVVRTGGIIEYPFRRDEKPCSDLHPPAGKK